jgi:hypothetical protein
MIMRNFVPAFITAILLTGTGILLSGCSQTNLSDVIHSAGQDGSSFCVNQQVKGPGWSESVFVARSNSPKAGSSSAGSDACNVLHNGDGNLTTPATAPTPPVAPTSIAPAVPAPVSVTPLPAPSPAAANFSLSPAIVQQAALDRARMLDAVRKASHPQ